MANGINYLIAQQDDYGVGNAFNKAQEQARVLNALMMAGKAAQDKQYGAAGNALIQAGQVPSGIDLIQAADPELAAGRTQFFQPQLFYGADGKPRFFQGSNRGGPLQEAQVPEGMTPAPNLGVVDTGTGYQFYDKRGGSGASAAPAQGGSGYAAPPVGPGASVPKDLAGKEAQEKVGAAAGDAQVALPAAQAEADKSLRLIQELRTHPGRKWATGKMSLAPVIPGTPQADFVSRFDQVKAKSFLQGFQLLKGAGAITDREGTRGEDAVGRLNRATTDAEFDSALNDLEGVYATGLQNLRTRAARSPTPSTEGDPLAEARDALARGAPREMVIQRLQENGIDPSGL